MKQVFVSKPRKNNNLRQYPSGALTKRFVFFFFFFTTDNLKHSLTLKITHHEKFICF